MNKILNFFSVFSVIGVCLKYYFDNRITLAVAGVILIGTVIIAAIDKPIWKFVKAGIAIVSIILLLASYSYNPNDFYSLLQPILVMLVALFGIYIMVRGLFKKKDDDEVDCTYNKKTGKIKRKW